MVKDILLYIKINYCSDNLLLLLLSPLSMLPKHSRMTREYYVACLRRASAYDVVHGTEGVDVTLTHTLYTHILDIDRCYPILTTSKRRINKIDIHIASRPFSYYYLRTWRKILK